MAGDSSWLDAMPEYYDRNLGPTLFEPYARHLAAIASARAPQDVLELAAGSGLLTAELVRALPSAHIVATDLNGAMVSWGARRVEGPTWITADAQSLDFPDASFDLVVCQFGVMFFPDKPKSFEQAARVLRPGGEYLFAVWDVVDESPLTAALVEALAEVLPEDPPDFVVRVPHGYHDPERIRADVEAGGLRVESVERVSLQGTAESVRRLAEGFCFGTPLRFELQERGDLNQLAASVAGRMEDRLGSGPVERGLGAFVVRARHDS